MANQPSAEELKKKLSEMQFYVTQDRGTEPPFTGRLLHNKRDGVYHCLVCDTPLFHSHTPVSAIALTRPRWPFLTRKTAIN